MYALRRQRFFTKICKFGGPRVPIQVTPVLTRFPKLLKAGGQSLTTVCTRNVLTIRLPNLQSYETSLRRYYGSQSYPSHIVVPMPALSPTMTMGNIGKWRKEIGDAITPGDVLVEIETDKAQMDFECQEEGYLAKILIETGAKDVNVGNPIAIIAEDQEDVQKFTDYVIEQSSTTPEVEQVEETHEPSAQKETSKEPPSEKSREPIKGRSPTDRILASPVARKLAAERGISLDQVTGTGPKDRIVKADILNFVPPSAPSPTVDKPTTSSVEATSEYTDIPLTNMRKVIAERLSESKQSIPHYYLTIEVEVDRLLKLREELNKDSDGKYKLSVNDFIIKSAALALLEIPEANSSWHGDFIRRYHNADVSVAVATPSGLITPVVKNAQAKGLASISRQVKELADRAKEGKLAPHEYQGGSFTVSNLGMFGIKSFTAIINPPQSCILAVGATKQKLVPDSSQETGYQIVNTMHVTLSCDHRVVDGALGAQWLSAWRSYMENPIKLIL
ncbi:10216_t:CDS:2 [Acaulospora morrowiae]|uniref:Acetyltransferase component of pyruvate dehydrogenase complex n=1 Tax=Acaulospora morrowiae TaxID=94023 RepID=A0A9N8W267_9GLOM|nr:10216_t:CDS:2 [Acaulospora morrowiae]